MENDKKNRRGFYKGVLTGILIAVLTGTVLLTSGCLLRPHNSSLMSMLNKSEGMKELESHYKEIEEKLATLQYVVDEYYLSDEEVSMDNLLDGIYKGYVKGLNEPYTVYYSPEEYAQLMESTSGKYSGIGVVVSQNMETGIITVVRPFPGSPGEQVGILKDDVIYKIDGKEATGVDVNTVVSWIKGEEGTYVDVEVFRPSEGAYITFTPQRQQIEVPMVEYKMLEDKIGYVMITEFEELTAPQFNAAIDDLLGQGMERLVIDLRDNPGGLVNAAVDVVDRILPAGKLVVYTEDKKNRKQENYTSDEDQLDLPIAVLINANTASASEIMSGCLQDYGRATIVGSTSFGKGIVQYVLPLTDGSAIKVTSAKYFTPNGRNIHKIGIEPDVGEGQDPESDDDDQLKTACELLLEGK